MSQVTFQAKHFLVFDGQLGILKLKKAKLGNVLKTALSLMQGF